MAQFEPTSVGEIEAEELFGATPEVALGVSSGAGATCRYGLVGWSYCIQMISEVVGLSSHCANCQLLGHITFLVS